MRLARPIILLGAMAVGCIAQTGQLASDVQFREGQPPKVFSETTIRAEQAVFHTGDRITLSVDSKNVSGQPVTCGQETKNPRISAYFYHVEVRDKTGASPHETKFGRMIRTGKRDPGEPVTIETGSSVERTIPPGGICNQGVDLSLIYDFTESGKYTAQIVNLDEQGRTLMKSNVVTFTIEK